MNENEIKGLKTLYNSINKLKVKVEEQYAKVLEKENSKSIKFKGCECFTYQDIDDVYGCGDCRSSERDKAYERLDKKKIKVGTDKYKIQLRYLEKFLTDIYDNIHIAEFENKSDDEKRKYYKELEEYLEEQEKENE